MDRKFGKHDHYFSHATGKKELRNREEFQVRWYLWEEQVVHGGALS